MPAAGRASAAMWATAELLGYRSTGLYLGAYATPEGRADMMRRARALVSADVVSSADED